MAEQTIEAIRPRVSERTFRIFSATIDDIVPNVDLSPRERDQVVAELVSDITFIVKGYRGILDGRYYPIPRELAGYFRYLATERYREGGLMHEVGSYLSGIAQQLDLATRVRVARDRYDQS